MHSYIWSGQDVLKDSYNLLAFGKIFESLNENFLANYIDVLKGRVKKKTWITIIYIFTFSKVYMH